MSLCAVFNVVIGLDVFYDGLTGASVALFESNNRSCNHIDIFRMSSRLLRGSFLLGSGFSWHDEVFR